MDRIVNSYQGAIEFVSNLAERYQISAIGPLLESCRVAANRSDLNVAVLGRFKAGKSSFLNDLIERDVLPVGVIPVTSAVTELVYNLEDRLEIRFIDGRSTRAPVAELRSYVSETENPHNRKHVAEALVQVAEMSRWRNIRFVDTPGLESAFAHNTEVSLAWAPNVDIALVAISVDPPLTQQDIELITKLLKYTSRIAILLTKVDVLAEREQCEVLEFVRTQLARNFDHEIPLFPYSTRPGYQSLRSAFEEGFLTKVASDICSQRESIVNRKITTLRNECEDYIRLTLKSAEMLDSERTALRGQALDERNALTDTKLNIQLVARNAAGHTRSSIEKALAPEEAVIRRELLEAFNREHPSFPRSFAHLLEVFEEWLTAALSAKLTAFSGAKRNGFVQPLTNAQRQYQRFLQNFRDRLSQQTMALYGVPLRTTEPDIRPEPPKIPDVKIGRAFDHNWELLSPILPMSLLRRAVLRRFRHKIPDETFKNLSRLTAQWTEIVTSAIFQLQGEAERRLEDLLATVEHLTSTPPHETQQIRSDLTELEAITKTLRIQR